MKTILKGGRVIDPANGRDGEFDVLIADGAITRIGKNLPVEDADVFEIKRGWIVAPGLVDTASNVAMMKPKDTSKWAKRDEIADVVVFLASPASLGITGQVLDVTGWGL